MDKNNALARSRTRVTKATIWCTTAVLQGRRTKQQTIWDWKPLRDCPLEHKKIHSDSPDTKTWSNKAIKCNKDNRFLLWLFIFLFIFCLFIFHLFVHFFLCISIKQYSQHIQYFNSHLLFHSCSEYKNGSTRVRTGDPHYVKVMW